MINIAVCDDDSVFLSWFCKKLDAYPQRLGLNHTIRSYSSGEQLINDDVFRADILFLDIEMSHLNGLEVAQILRRRSKDVKLIFVSGNADYARQGYKYKAFSYLWKDELDKELEPCMKDLLATVEPEKTMLDFKFTHLGIASINVADIMYLESDLHKVYFYFADDTPTAARFKTIPYTNHLTLNKIQAYMSFSNLFLRIDQSHLVNKNHIRNAVHSTCYLKNGQQLSIAEGRYKPVKEFIRFRGKI